MYAADNGDKLCSPDTYLNDSTAPYPYFWWAGTSQPDLFSTAHWVAQGSGSYYINPTGNSEQAITNGALWRYTQAVKMYKCKTDKSPRRVSYAMSIGMGPSMYYGIPPKLPRPLLRPRALISLNQISKPSERMVLIDATTYRDISHYNQVNWLSGPFCNTSAFLLNGPDPPTWYGPFRFDSEMNPNITKRHTNGCNLSFSDLHCEYWRWEDKRTIKMIDGDLDDYIDASPDNPDLERMLKLLYLRE